MADAGDFLRRAAARARHEPGLLGALLAGYSARAGLDDAGLAAALGCGPDQLACLALCRPPRPARFRADVEQIAGRIGLDPLALTRLLRLAGALDALAGAVPDAEGLRAARRADEPNEEPPPEEEPR